MASLERVAGETNPKTFCRRILPHVSRTFSLGIRVLSGNTYWAMCVGYLLCRALDTLEDSVGLSDKKRAGLLRSMAAFLPNPPEPTALRQWQNEANHLTATPAESLLLERVGLVLSTYKTALPRQYREAMLGPIREMAQGMASVLERFGSGNKPSQLRSQSDLNHYCYFVAGTVGRLITNVFSLELRSEGRRERLKANDVAYGHGLQLLNIVKDFGKDLRRGWCYLPKAYIDAGRPQFEPLLRQVQDHLLHGLPYLEALPYRHFRKRLFCLLPLLFASKNLDLLRRALVQKTSSRTRLSRRQVRSLTLLSVVVVWNKHLVRWGCKHLLQQRVVGSSVGAGRGLGSGA